MNVLLFFVIVRCLGSQKWALAKLTEKWEMGRKERDGDREKNLFERIWDVPKGEKPDFWKKWIKGCSENLRTNINHCSLSFRHESIPRLFCLRITPLKIQVPGSRLQWFCLAHHPLPNSRESWAGPVLTVTSRTVHQENSRSKLKKNEQQILDKQKQQMCSLQAYSTFLSEETWVPR